MTLPSLADVRTSEPKPAGEAEIEEHLQVILSSPVFEKAGTLRTLLIYLCEHRGQAISEYAVATEALGKKSDFEPKIDASVRVRIARLRQKLDEFYLRLGRDAEIRFAIPLGGHDLRVVRVSRVSPPEEPVAEPRPARPVIAIVLGSLLLVAAALYVQTLVSNQKLRQALADPAATTRQALPPFWQNFFSNGKPASLFVSTPTFFEFSGNNIKVRDTTVNDFASGARSVLLQRLAKEWGPPKLLQNYTVASDTFAALRLVQYLQPKDVQLSVGGTAELSVESAGDRNIIVIGVAGTSRQVNELLSSAPFYVADGATHVVRNRAPLPGEPAGFNIIEESTARWVTPGIIAVLPGRVPGTRLLVLTGFYTYPLVYSLATPSPLAAIDSAWKRAGSPRFFEAVMNSEVEAAGTSVLRATVAAFRALPGKN
jgi:hypothetical protein